MIDGFWGFVLVPPKAILEPKDLNNCLQGGPRADREISRATVEPL